MRYFKIVFYFLLSTVLFGCHYKTKEDYRRFHVSTSHDNNWTTSGSYYVDSIEYKSKTEAIIYTDGKSMKIFAPMIKCFEQHGR